VTAMINNEVAVSRDHQNTKLSNVKVFIACYPVREATL